jgi:hypothetical protein
MKCLFPIALIICGLIPNIVNAKVDYISLHSVDLNTSQALLIKLNIVEKNETSPLKFLLKQSTKTTKLSYDYLNKYMLTLKGSHAVYGDAAIIVYQKTNDSWDEVRTIHFNSPPTQGNLTSENNVVSNPTSILPLTVNTINDEKLIDSKCSLIRFPKETLWGLASRYSKQWNVDIYSTIIAIYTQNKNQFSKRHIKLLKDDSVLTCPNKSIMSSLGSKALMKEEFESLHAKPVN